MNILPPFSVSKSKQSRKPAKYRGLFLSDFLLDIFFDREDRGDEFLRNVGLTPNCTALKYKPILFNSNLFD
jgi:hypothetical protein